MANIRFLRVGVRLVVTGCRSILSVHRNLPTGLRCIVLRRKVVSETKKHEKVFVVDDEFIIASTLAMILKQNGFEANYFTDPLKALEASGKDAPDLLISDVVMPEMSGIDLAIAIRQRLPGCRVLLFSGQATTANLFEEARRSGYEFDVLSKPVHPSELLKRIRMETERATA
jgi:DNA-binding NtrC family response regulator